MDHFDVIIVGAGLSGIGAAYHLQQKCPTKRYTILESRDVIGGTWDLFRYPGVRSDSDMHTLGYNFKPWREAKALADGPSILKYVVETATDNDITPHIRFGHKVVAADFSTADARWTVRTETLEGGNAQPRTRLFSCNLLFMCSGYYRYAQGHIPEFAGIDDFQGQILSPQNWPEELDYRDKRVVVIGSGATAMTLVPAMAESAASVTMVQRSPTYVVSRPDQDKIANLLRKLLPEDLAYRLTRFKNVQLQRLFYNRSRSQPEKVKKTLIDMVRKELGPDYDVDTHFTPRYNPWDQRLCLVPNSNLFKALKSGKADVVTQEIDRFTDSGLRLGNGETIAADIVVTATGLDLVILGEAKFSVDGKPVDFHETYSYKGMMYSDVPNLVQTFGYINASWTLRADLTCEYVCRLLNHMDELAVQQCTPRLREEDEGMAALPWIQGFSSGYMQRIMHLFPKQGDRGPWRNTQNYALDKKMIRHEPLEDGALLFTNAIDDRFQATDKTQDLQVEPKAASAG